MRFGQIEAESMRFASTDMDGIMGMAYEALTENNGDVAFQQISKANNIPDKFSMCLTNAGGELILGGFDENKYSEDDFVFTPITKEEYYNVQAGQIYVNGESVDVDTSLFENTIIDSGTTLLLLASPVFNTLSDFMVTEVCPTMNPDYSPACIQIWSGSQQAGCLIVDILDQFPDISFTFDGTPNLTLTSRDYFFTVEAQGQTGYCLGIANGGPGNSIFGDIFMQKFNTLFDRENHQIGFAPVHDCSSSDATMTGSNTNQTLQDPKASSQPLSVQVTYADGSPAIGLIVDFEITQGKGDLQNVRRMTDSQGRCNTTVIVKQKENTIRATLFESKVSVEFQIHSPNAGSGSSGLSTVQIVAIIIGVVAFVAILAIILGVFFYFRKRNMSNDIYHPTQDQESVLMRPDQDFD